jgi:hypothetical protein
MNPNLSNAMKTFWENKTSEEKMEINSKRGSTIKNNCIYMKNEGRSYPCKFEFVLDRLALGHLIVSTNLNRAKVANFFGEIPELFFTKNKK